MSASVSPFIASAGGNFYLWGGRGDTDPKTIFVFCQWKRTWRRQPTEGAHPPAGLCNGGCAKSGRFLYFYGGSVDSTRYDDLYKLDTGNWVWKKVCKSGTGGPGKKDGCRMIAYKNNLLVVGGHYGKVPVSSRQAGASYEVGRTNEAHLYDLTTGLWSSPFIKGSRPPPCSSFSLTMTDEDEAVMFGGNTPSGESSEAYFLQLPTMTWIQYKEENSWPGRRYFHIAACLGYGTKHKRLLISGGGCSGVIYDDMWLLDPCSGRMEKLEVPFNYKKLVWRWGHVSATVVSYRDRISVVLFGGCKDGGVLSVEVAVVTFDLQRISSGEDKWSLTDIANHTELGSLARLSTNRRIIQSSITQVNLEARMTQSSMLQFKMEGKVRGLERQLQQFQIKEAEFHRRADDLLKQTNDSSRKANNFQRENADMKRRAEEFQRQAEVSNNRAETLESEVVDLNKKAETLQRQVAVSNKKAETLQRQVAVSNKKAETLQRQIAVSNKKAETLQRQVAESNKNARTFQKEAEISHERAQTLQKEAEISYERAQTFHTEAEKSNERAQSFHKEAEVFRERAQLFRERAQVFCERAQVFQKEAEISHERAQIFQKKAEISNERAQLFHRSNQRFQRQVEITNECLFITQQNLRCCEEDLQIASSHWVIRREEIELTGCELGVGAWATVTVAKFRGTEVAVKRFHRQIISHHNWQLFQREMNMAARLHHPNLIQFIGATAEGESMIVMELMSTSLRIQLEKEVNFQPNIVKAISLDIARGLNYLHLVQPDPIVHRDISSANVLLEELPHDNWRVKITDYGSVNLVRKLSTQNPGSPVYSAPEAADSHLQSPKMDIYSFGALILEMLTGQLPAPEQRPGLLCQVHHEQLLHLIRRCLKEKREDRPSAGDIISELSS